MSNLNVEANCLMQVDINKYLVIGAGVSGLSVTKYFLSHAKQFRVMDTRDLPPNVAEIKSLLKKESYCFGEFKRDWLEWADTIILSPGIAPQIEELDIARNNGTEIIGDIELFAREATKPYLAITGSNGKSTVTMLVTEILKSQGINAKACANIGEPALAVVDQDIDIFVLELSSFQLETCSSLAAKAAVVLNISDDHLDRHLTIEQYAEIKARIYHNAELKVIPRDQSTKQFIPSFDAYVSFGLDIPTENNFGIKQDNTGRWLAKGGKKIINSGELPLLGEVGELNVLAAFAITDRFIHDYEQAAYVIKSFQGLAHRCQLVATKNDIQWIDDSKGTNIGATVAAIKSITRPLILIVGGVHKGGSLDDLVQITQGRDIKVITFGRDGHLFSEALDKHADVIQQQNLNACIELAHHIAQPGQAVLFSPACASFDMYTNYIERGLAFQSEVHNKLQVNHGC